MKDSEMYTCSTQLCKNKITKPLSICGDCFKKFEAIINRPSYEELEAKVRIARNFRSYIVDWIEDNEWSNANLKELKKVLRRTQPKESN